MISNHRLLGIEIVVNNKLKLEKMKEIIEPYIIAMNKNKDITNK